MLLLLLVLSMSAAIAPAAVEVAVDVPDPLGFDSKFLLVLKDYYLISYTYSKKSDVDGPSV